MEKGKKHIGLLVQAQTTSLRKGKVFPPFIIWVVSCIVFNLLIFSNSTEGPKSVLFMVALISGFLAFFVFLHRFSKRYGDSSAVIMAIILVVGFFLSLATMTQATQFFANKQSVQPIKNFQNIISPTPSIYPTTITAQNQVQQPQSNQIDCVGPDNKTFRTSMAECENLNRSWGQDANYMVNCGIHAKCGGGSVWISKKACNNTICCTYSNGSSVFLYDSSQCKSNSSNSQQLPPVYIPPMNIPNYAADHQQYTQQLVDEMNNKFNSYPTFAPSNNQPTIVSPTWPAVEPVKPTPVCVLMEGGQLVCQ
jgi:hypothetical protein